MGNASSARKRHLKGLRHRQWRDGAVRCCYCDVALIPHQGRTQPGTKDERMETLEHLKRQIDGGGNEPGNLALACLGCNISRGNLDWCTFKSLKMGELSYVG